MKKFYFFTTLFLLFSQFSNVRGNQLSGLDFIPNIGQWEDDFLYKVPLLDGGTLFMEKTSFTFHYYDEAKKSWLHHHQCPIENETESNNNEINKYCDNDRIKHHVYKMNFLGANANIERISIDPKNFYNNYFLGSDPVRWKGEVNVYSKIEYKNFYNGIDLVAYSDENAFKYDYIVQPNGNPNQIQVQYVGLDKIFVDARGNLLLNTSLNSITEYAPYVYQLIDGKEKEISAKYVLNPDNIVTIKIIGKYDKNLPLVIDPTLLASTYTGSTSDNWGYTATFDNNGNMYAGGMAVGNGYPTSIGAFDASFNGGSTATGLEATDIVISKFSADGTTLLWSTYIGGSNNELPHSLLVNSNDELVMFGTTGSNNFPITTGPTFGGGNNVLCGGSIGYNNGSDIVLLKLNSSGSALINARYFGGTGNDGLNTTNSNNLEFNYGDYARGDIEFDANGNIVLASCSYSATLPGTAGHFQTSNGGALDAIIVKFSSDLASVQWSTFYGGSGNDAAYDIEIESDGNLIIAGGTQSSNLPGMNGLNSTYLGAIDGYLTRLNSNGTNSLNGTYLGTNEYDQAYFVDTDQFGFVYAYGHTIGQYPVLANWSRDLSPQFIHKLSHNLSTTEYSTVFGRINYVSQNKVNLSPTAFLVDKCENVYCMGWGGTSNISWNNNTGTTQNMGQFGTGTGSIFNSGGDSDFYLFVLEKDANNALFGSRLGESDNAFFGTGADHVDGGTSRFDPNGYVYHAVCASCGGSDNFPTTPNAFSGDNRSSNCNLAVFKIEFDLSPINAEIGLDSDIGCAPLTINFENLTNKPFVAGMTILWDFGDGSTAIDIENPIHTFTDPGTYTIQLIVIDSSECNTSDTAEFELVVSESGAISDFTMDVSDLCNTGEVVFTNNSLNAASYIWIYGDGNSSTTNSMVHSHTYTGSGPYIVSLVAVDGSPCATNDTLSSSISGGCCPIFESLNFTNESCNLNNATISISVGNSGVGPYDYSLNGGASFILIDFAGNADFPSLNSGTYNIIVRDANNCSIDTSITITNSGFPNTLTINQFSCLPSDTGINVLNLQNQSGCDSIVTIITDLVNEFNTVVDLETCDPANVGIVIDTFTTAFGCDSIVVINTTFVDFFSDTIFQSSCDPLMSGTETDSFITSIGCDSIITTITTTSPSSIDTLNNTSCEIANIGTTSTTFINQFGCDSTIIEITTLSSFSLDSLAVSNADCNGENGQLDIYVSGANVPIQYVVTNLQGISTTFTTSSSLLDAGTYTLTITDATQCNASSTFIIDADSAINVDVIPDSASIFEGESIDLTAIPADGLFQWTPPDFLNCFDCPAATSTPASSLYYIITRNLDGCLATDTIFIKVKKPDGFIPSAFTPNGDGLNDVLYVLEDFVKELKLFKIYNRWGTLIFETTNLQEGWDGKYNGKEQDLDTYIYHIEIILKTDHPISLSGPVLLFR